MNLNMMAVDANKERLNIQKIAQAKTAKKDKDNVVIHKVPGVVNKTPGVINENNVLDNEIDN